MWFWNKSYQCPHLPCFGSYQGEVSECMTKKTRAMCAPGTQLILLPLEIDAHPQDQLRANLYDVADTGSSAPTVLLGRSALLSLHCSLLGFSVFCSCIFRSLKSHLVTRIPDIHRAGTWDRMGGVITQSLSHCVSKAQSKSVEGLANFYWNCCFVEVENNLFAESKIFRSEEATMPFSLTSN